VFYRTELVKSLALSGMSDGVEALYKNFGILADAKGTDVGKV